MPGQIKMAYMFRLEARNRAGNLVKQLGKPVRITIDFDDLEARDWGQTFVQLYYFDDSASRWVLVPAQVDMAARRIVAEVRHFTDFGFGGDVNTLPSTPSNLEGFSVDLCTGYAQAGMSLKVPPGIQGLAPSLRLGYSSGIADTMNGHWIADGNSTDAENSRTRLQASPVGLGWALDLGAIFRSTNQDPMGRDLFYLVKGTHTYELGTNDDTNYRTKPDEFLRVKRTSGGANEADSHEYWTIEARDGTTYRYGYNPDSEQRAGKYQYGEDGVQKAWQWSLDQVTDLHGNRMDVTYTEVSAQPPSSFQDSTYYDQAAYPSRITYTANGPQGFAANREVRFVYSDRTDAVAKTDQYTQYYWTKKLDRIEEYVAGSLVRTYEFAYSYQTPSWHTEAADGAQAPYAQVSGLPKLTLTSITEKEASGNPLPATSFTYLTGTIPGTSEQAKLQLATVSNGYGGVSTYSYEGHTPDGWWKLPRRYRVKGVSVDPGTGTGAGVSGVVTRGYGYGTSYNGSYEGTTKKTDNYDYRGHDWVTVTDSAGNYSKSYFYTRDAVTGQGDLDRVAEEVVILQSRALIAESWAAGAGAYTTRSETLWGITFTLGLANFPHVDEARSFTRTQSGSIQDRKVRYDHDGYGNLVSTKEYDSASAPIDSWTRGSISEYYPSEGLHYLAGYLARKALIKANGDVLSDVRYCYDGSDRHDNPIGSGLYGDDETQRARLTAVRAMLDGSRCVDITYGYDGYGRRNSATSYAGYGTPGGAIATSDPRTSTLTFESTYQTYPYQLTNPIGHLSTRLYDARWGVPTQATDINGGVSDYSYDSFGRLTSAMGPQVAGPNGDCRATAQYFYFDPAQSGGGRWTTKLKTQVRTDLGGATPSWRSSWAYYDGIGRVVQSYADTEGGVNVACSYFDPRGLKVKDSIPHLASASESFLESDWASYSGALTSYSFDELGRLTQTSLPDGRTVSTMYDGWSREGIDQKGHKRRYEADWAGRVTSVVEYTGSGPYSPYATTSYSHDLADRLVGVVDAVGNQTSISYDGLGRKVGMIDPDMGIWSYEYDPTGALSAQTDARESRTEFSYDRLGRLTRKWYRASWTQDSLDDSCRVSLFDLMELRCALDTDLVAAGLSPYPWTDPAIVAGRDVPVRAVHLTELKGAIQALWTAAGMGGLPEFSAGAILAGSRSIKTSDPLDVRKWLGEYEESGHGTLYRARALYQYDSFDGTSQFGRGRRTSSWDGSGHSSTHYDRAGRAYRGERTIDGTTYTSRQTFDALSRTIQATLPDDEVISYAYGSHGLLIQMSSSLGVDYLSGVGYNVLGQPRQYTLGSGTTATASLRYYGLDVTGYPFGALQGMQLQQGSSPMLVDREMTYDQVGNVTGVNDRVNGENVSYGYDDLDRLTSAGSPLSEGYTYSEIGNLTSKNGSPLSYTDPSHVHAVTAFAVTAYSYDPNGSMTARGTGSIRYDAERRPVRVNEGATVLWRAAYDGDGGRRKRVDGKGTIHYLGGYERNAGNGMDTTEVVTKYYRALGRLIAFRRNGTLYWVGTDHLGGTVSVANSSFGLVAGMRYTPYGISRDNIDDPLTDTLFTSQKLDASIGLYWYGSRAYDQSLGRFVSPDSIVPSAGNPQSLNRFSYAANNPMRYADPSGHDPYEGMGIVVYDNPSYLSTADRQTLYEHNSQSSVSNGSQGTVNVHESGGGGGGGGDPLAGLGIIDTRNYRDAYGNVIEPSYLPVEVRQALYQHNMSLSNGGASGSMGYSIPPIPSSWSKDRGNAPDPAQAELLQKALLALKDSSPEGAAIYHDFVDNGGEVRFGGFEPVRNGGNSVGFNGTVFLGPQLQQEPPELVAALIAHEIYHAQDKSGGWWFKIDKEVNAYNQEANIWKQLRVSYSGPHDDQYQQLEDIAAASGSAEGLRTWVKNQPLYRDSIVYKIFQ